MIVKRANKYVLYSRSKKKGKRRRLGVFKTKEAALKRERQIQFFKHFKNKKI